MSRDDYVWAQFIDNRIVPVGDDELSACAHLTAAVTAVAFQDAAMLLTSALISGIGLGSMYGLLALGFYVTYAVSGDGQLRAGQLDDARRGPDLSPLRVTLGWPLPLAVALALALCALYGLLVEFVAVRPFVQTRLERVADGDRRARHRRSTTSVLFTFGKEPRSLPSPLARRRSARRRRHSASIRCRSSFRSSGSLLAAALHTCRRAHALAARRCSRSCRTATPRA